jgi:hypothetical protein
MRVVIIVTAALLGCAALLVWRTRSEDGRQPPDPSAAVAGLDDEVQRLRREVRALKAQTNYVAAQKSPLEAATTADPDTATRAKDQLTPEQRKERRRTVLNAWYGSIDARFADETIDQSWGPEATRSLESLITRNAGLGTLQSARCARTMCKVVVNHADGDKQRQFAAQMSEESQLDTEVAYKYDVEVNPPTTTMWVARAGHKIPRASSNNP